MKYPFDLVTLWAYPRLFLLSESIVYKITDPKFQEVMWDVIFEKSNVRTDVAVRTSSWSSDDKRTEFFRNYMLRLVLVFQYFTNASFIVLSSLVRR